MQHAKQLSSQTDHSARITTTSQSRKANTEKRKQLVVDYFTDLYEVQRIRYEDCLQRTCDRFVIAPSTVVKIVKQKANG